MPVKFMAEVSSNHAADLSRCLEFIDAAADIGCDAIKFQLFRIEKLFAPEILEKSKKHRLRKAWELPLKFLSPIAERCCQRKIEFCCTPFDLEAVDLLEPYVSTYKIASYELTWPDLHRACAQTGKAVILSTGMADLAECVGAVNEIRKVGIKSLSLLHCVSHYPALPEESNLAAIASLREATGADIGWSDHTVNAGVIHQAVFGMGASMIEFHLDLDGNGAEFAAGHCWLPQAMARVIRDVRDGEKALGRAIKAAAQSEEEERLWRADPSDGLRPFKEIRKNFKGDDV